MVNASHFLNDVSSILFTPTGSVTVVRAVQPENAYPSIFFTPFGIIMLCKELQLLKAQKPIVVVPSGMTATPFLISKSAIIYKFYRF